MHSQTSLVTLKQSLDVFTHCNYNLKVKFEWDDKKRKLNIIKHGIDFTDAPLVFAGYTLTVEDSRYDYGEQR
jgi:hypothetical protein